MIPISRKKKNNSIFTIWLRSKTGWLTILFLAVLTYLSQDHIFFWDTIQFAGKHGQWFYDQHFREWLLPESIDSGHPPVFGWYLASIWMLFGKSLAVSHWAMFTFLAGMVWQLLRLGRAKFNNIHIGWLLLVVLLDPVLLGQSVLVSPDVVLIFFFLWGLNSLEAGQSPAFALACLGMAAISTRGMMLVAGLGLYQLWTGWPELKSFRLGVWWTKYRPYLPAALFSLAFIWIHYQQTGWIGYHADSPWASNFERVDLRGFIRNLGILGWRWLDYGRIFLWGIAAFLVFKHRRAIVETGCNPSLPGQMMVLLFCITGMLSISFLMYRGLHAHRYLLPAFLIFNITCLIGIDRLNNRKLRQPLLVIALLAMITGNLWIYPERIAQGWDATLAHWPYYELRDQMLDHLAEQRIPLGEVGTAFPDIGPLNDRDLSGRMDGFKAKSLDMDRYILYSNIMNDFTDVEIAELQEEWTAIAQFRRMGVFLTLYERSE